MFHTILDDGDARTIRAQTWEPRGSTFSVIRLGGHKNPIDGRCERRICNVSRLYDNSASWRFHRQPVEGSPCAQNNLMLSGALQKTSHNAADRTYTNYCNFSHS
jgi:hypothetical protein